MKTETEHLLYYSISGFFVFFFVYMFILLVDGGISAVTSTLVALSIALAIPVGYITYQAYVMTIYRRVWEKWFKVSDPCFELLNIDIKNKLKLLDEELAEKVKKCRGDTCKFFSTKQHKKRAY